MGGGSKKNAKGRLDKYYHMAKEHGYRSRAAFKLIQLNKKYQFLSNSKVVVDLCAAPGGWLQVCSKYMPMASIKIGVDLDPIKAIKGCVTFQCDITTPKCTALIKKELKHFQCDVVLNDGAPNVGTDWNLDAYQQIELSLHAVKLATTVLKKGGTFVTKVFRSKDYNSFLYILNSLFTKVESSKPPSSRSQSAEIFMVCLGYKAPDYIDPKFLDPKYAFEDIEKGQGGVDGNEVDATNNVTSLKQLLKTKKPNRMGYDTDKMMIHEVCDFFDFLESAEPFDFLSKYQEFTLDRKAEDAFIEHKLKKPLDLVDIISDIKVCGRGELSKLLTLRHKYQSALKALRVPEEKEPKEELSPEEQIEKELNQAVARIERDKKRAFKKDRDLKKKNELRQKMSVIATQTGQDNDEEMYLNPRVWEKLRETGMENLSDAESVSDSDVEDSEEIIDDGSEIDEMDVNDKQNAIERLAAEMEDNIAKQNEFAAKRDRRLAGKQLKAKSLVESQRQLREDLEEDDEMQNRDLMDVSESDADKESSEDPEPEPLKELMDDMEGKDIESEGHSSEEEDEKNLFVNPLTMVKNKNKKEAKKNVEEVSEGEWSDDDQKDGKGDKGGPKSKRAQKKKVLGKRSRDEVDDEDKAKDFFGASAFQEVPADDPDSKLRNDNEESMDSTEMAETRILAKKMLRKKQRTELLDATYNRFSFHEDPNTLPTWFNEDESKHYWRHHQSTKEEMAEEKQEIKAYNARPSKKVEEAKNRKKKRLVKAMQKVRSKAQIIADQDLNEQTKMRQIQKMYAKEKSQHVEEKKYVVNRKFSNVQGRKSARGTKMVDGRLKKDMWKDKKAGKKGNKEAKGGKGKGRGKK